MPVESPEASEATATTNQPEPAANTPTDSKPDKSSTSPTPEPKGVTKEDFRKLEETHGFRKPKSDEPAQDKGDDKKDEKPEAKPETPAVDERFVKALKRDGWSDEDIAALSPERVRSIGERRAKNHADVDGYSQKMKDLEKRIEELSKPKADEKKPVTIEDALKSYEDQYGPELAGGLKPIVEALREQERQRISELERTMAEYRIQAQEREIDSLRKTLVSDWPDIDNDEKFTAVREAMNNLDRAGIYKTIPELMQAACRLTMSVTAKDVQARLTKHAEARRLGQPHDSVKNTQGVPKTREERDKDILKRLEAKHGLTD